MGQLSAVIPWPVLCLATVAIVIACGAALTGVLARTPLAVPLTVRTRVPWRRPRPLSLQSTAVTASDQDAVTDAVTGEIQSPRRAA
jgi:hypothetical protein